MKLTLYIAAVLTAFLPTTTAAIGDRPGDEISSDDIHRAAVELLEERFPSLAGSAEIRVDRIGSTAEDASAVRIRLGHRDAVPKGRTQVRIQARSGGDAWRDAGWALIYVSHFDSVAVAHNTVEKGDEIDADDLTFAWVETTTFRGEPLRPGDYRQLAPDGLFAARTVRSGESVRLRDVRPAFAADTGESLAVTYERNGILLKLTCQAREPGATGDVIRAYSPDTKATYKVELTGPGTAVWKSTL